LGSVYSLTHLNYSLIRRDSCSAFGLYDIIRYYISTFYAAIGIVLSSIRRLARRSLFSMRAWTTLQLIIFVIGMVAREKSLGDKYQSLK